MGQDDSRKVQDIFEDMLDAIHTMHGPLGSNTVSKLENGVHVAADSTRGAGVVVIDLVPHFIVMHRASFVAMNVLSTSTLA